MPLARALLTGFASFALTALGILAHAAATGAGPFA